jgi:hypothetical protein
MQSAGRHASSYYDPEGETIYLSPTPAPKGPEKGRRRPELNDVFGYVGSATLLLAYLFVANQILRKHPVVVDCMNLFGSACVRFGAETKFHAGAFASTFTPSTRRLRAQVGFNCFCKKAYAPMFLEICWFGIAFAAMVKHSI